MRVTHPYVEVPDHSDAWMCAKDRGGGGGIYSRPLCSYKDLILGEHSMEAVIVAATTDTPTHCHM